MSSLNVEALGDRFKRVSRGVIQSGVDELLSARTPIQLGGMSDPFMPMELRHGTTLDALRELARYNYPVLISTKSKSVGNTSVINVLRESNVEVRLSCAALPSDIRQRVDKGCSSFEELMISASKLTEYGIRTSLRLQPLFPGYEKAAEEYIGHAAEHGVTHVSLEYVKVPLERGQRDTFWRSMGRRYRDCWEALFSEQDGRELRLPLSYRAPHLFDLKKAANNLGLTVGMADNELLHFSDLDSCCNSAAKLEDCNPFRSNYLGLLTKSRDIDELRVEEIESLWIPERSLGVYLNSKSRISQKSFSKDWREYLRRAWNGETNAVSPQSFYGVSSNQKDANGFNIYKFSAAEAERLLAINAPISSPHPPPLTLTP